MHHLRVGRKTATLFIISSVPSRISNGHKHTEEHWHSNSKVFNNDFQSRQRLHEQSIGSLFQFPQDLLLEPANSMATVRQLERCCLLRQLDNQARRSTVRLYPTPTMYQLTPTKKRHPTLSVRQLILLHFQSLWYLSLIHI